MNTRRFLLGIAHITNKLLGRDITQRWPWTQKLRGLLVQVMGVFDPAMRRKKKFERDNPDAPWWAIGSHAVVENILRPDFVCFEFGAGRSSLWLAQRVKHVISLEANKEWLDKITTKRDALGLRDKLTILFHDIPSEYHANVADKHAYLQYLSASPDGPFDMIFVDALFRVEAFPLAFDHVKRGGYVVLDNADLEGLAGVIAQKKDYLVHMIDDGVWATAVFYVPAA